MATHSSILTWRIPWTEELGGPQSMSCKESDTTERLHFHFLSVSHVDFNICIHCKIVSTMYSLVDICHHTQIEKCFFLWKLLKFTLSTAFTCEVQSSSPGLTYFISGILYFQILFTRFVPHPHFWQPIFCIYELSLKSILQVGEIIWDLSYFIQQCSQGPSLSLQKARFYSCLWLNNILSLRDPVNSCDLPGP